MGISFAVQANRMDEEYERSMQALEKEMGIDRFRLFLELIEQSNSILRKKL